MSNVGTAQSVKEHLETYRRDPDKGHDWNPYGKPTHALLLTTIGRRTGKLRTLPLVYRKIGDNYVVVASKGGSPEDPFWSRNLQAHPEAEIQVRHDHIKVRARIAAGEERAALWRAMVEELPQYEEYQARTEREIPVIVLEPRD